jgi:hypothetical protein
MGCIMKTDESIVARDCVLDHSDVMTALRGYSAPIPTVFVSIQFCHFLRMVGSQRLVAQEVSRTNAHDKTPPNEQPEKGEIIVAMTASGDSNRRNNNQDELNAIEASSTIAIRKVAKEDLTNDGSQECKEVNE